MTSFATIAQRSAPADFSQDDQRPPVSALVWEQVEDGRFRVVKRVKDVAELLDAGGSLEVEIYAFEVATSDQPNTAANKGSMPVLDADGSPLWANARITFQLPSFYINVAAGAGKFDGADMYGGIRYVSDDLMTIYDRRGFAVDSRRENYSSIQTYVTEGELSGSRLLAGRLGDRHEHGQVETFIRLASDPRDVCKLIMQPQAPSP